MTTVNTVQVKSRTGTSSDWKKMIDLIYPIGSYYISSKPTSPSTLFGGDWIQITGRFLYAVHGTSELTPGISTQGGNNDSIVPYHKHEMIQASYNFSGNTMGSHTHNFTGSQDHSHVHDHQHYILDDYAGNRVPVSGVTWSWDDSGTLMSGSGKIYPYIETGGNSVTHGTDTKTSDLTFDEGKIDPRTSTTTVRISGTTGPSNTGKPSGNINLSSAASVNYTGTGGNTINANMPAYQKVYCWCRQA